MELPRDDERAGQQRQTGVEQVDRRHRATGVAHPGMGCPLLAGRVTHAEVLDHSSGRRLGPAPQRAEHARRSGRPTLGLVAVQQRVAGQAAHHPGRAEPVGCQNSAMASDRRFQAAASY